MERGGRCGLPRSTAGHTSRVIAARFTVANSRAKITTVREVSAMTYRPVSLVCALLCVSVSAVAQRLPQLQVSDNRRFLVTADGRPFFWLGDTAWELFHRLSREDVDRYLRKRAGQRFTVIQAVVLAEFDGLTEPNAY